MKKYINFLIYTFTISLSIINMAYGQSWYNYAGALSIIKDHHQQAWVYMGVEYINNQKRLAILAGQKEKQDTHSLDTALRELHEESLDVFSDYINSNHINEKLIPQISYNVWFFMSTKLYLFVINEQLSDDNCDKFIELYNERRYNGTGKYKKLKLAQRESYELRKVKLNELIDFLNNPNKNDAQLISYGGKKCDTEHIPLRWSSQIMLQNQPTLQSLIN
jgi:hypothetical protein